MTALARRDALHTDFPEWITRWLADRNLTDRLLPAFAGSGIRIEELDEDGVHVVRAELPGIDPYKDVEISVHDGMLHVQGRRSERSDDRRNGTFRSEFRYGSFSRTLPLPAGATVEDVSATYRDGLLEVRLPVRKDEQAASDIPVQRID